MEGRGSKIIQNCVTPFTNDPLFPNKMVFVLFKGFGVSHLSNMERDRNLYIVFCRISFVTFCDVLWRFVTFCDALCRFVTYWRFAYFVWQVSEKTTFAPLRREFNSKGKTFLKGCQKNKWNKFQTSKKSKKIFVFFSDDKSDYDVKEVKQFFRQKINEFQSNNISLSSSFEFAIFTINGQSMIYVTC